MTPTLHMSVAKDIRSKLTTSGATNSGVPNNTCNRENILPSNEFFYIDFENGSYC